MNLIPHITYIVSAARAACAARAARAARARAARPPRHRAPARDRANVHHIAPHLRVLASQQQHFKGVWRHDNITPKISLKTLSPGHFEVRAGASKHAGADRGMRQIIISLLRRAPKHIYVNGHKHTKKAALTVIMRMLEKRQTVDIQLRKL